MAPITDAETPALPSPAGARGFVAPRPRALRPRDAGTLILLDESGATPRVLMGRRSSRLAFMPGKYVFPGGRLETGDLGWARHFALQASSRDRLLAQTAASFSERRALAIALAAVRETFEEVGALVGKAGGIASGDGFFPGPAGGSVLPDPAGLAPVARAITPPGHIRRFDTRFFCASADTIAAIGSFERQPGDEFDHVDWFSLDHLAALDLPGITRHVLADIDTRLRDGSWRDTSRAMPFYRTRFGRPVREMI